MNCAFDCLSFPHIASDWYINGYVCMRVRLFACMSGQRCTLFNQFLPLLCTTLQELFLFIYIFFFNWFCSMFFACFANQYAVGEKFGRSTIKKNVYTYNSIEFVWLCGYIGWHFVELKKNWPLYFWYPIAWLLCEAAFGLP